LALSEISSVAQLKLASETKETEIIRTPFAVFWNKFKKQKAAVAAGVFILLLIFITLIGPLIVPYSTEAPDYDNILAPPSAAHWAGTDNFGRDIFSRVIVGTRYSLWVGLSSVILGAVAGTILGLLSGFYGGWVDTLIMRTCDVKFAFPGILLAIAIIAIIGPGMVNAVIAIAIFSIPIFARIIRGSTLVLKSSLYVESARSIGASNTRMIWRHIFPGTISSFIVYFTMRTGSAILIGASLSFLGLGAQPPTPEWGAMLSSGRSYLNTAPFVAFFPGVAIFVTVLALNLLGDGIRDALDPKIKD
jgi:glutathione transport system permease protein